MPSHNVLWGQSIRTGRHHRPKPLPIHERFCLNCKTVEDELHHLLHCKKFVNIRSPLIKMCMSNIPRFKDMSMNDRFVQIMKSRDLRIINELGVFLNKASSGQDIE